MRAIIVGGSHAGAQLCASLRQEGWDGELLVIGDEPILPYHRPPLSKAYLAGKSTLDELLIRPADFYAKNDIAFRHAGVVSIDRDAHSLTLSDGEKVGYDKLALCLGARPRRLPLAGTELAGVHYLRYAADIEAIRSGVAGAGRVVIIGAGYIGLETAASLRKRGVEVTVLEHADRVMQRVTAPEVSAFYARVHREEGVDIRTGVAISAIEGDDSVRGVRLADGELIEADLVIIGVGVVPNTELAEAAGLAVDNGIIIDDHALTNDPDIVAAGDCVSHFMHRYGRRLRLESVPSAGEQAKVAAATICGKVKTVTALPWFWSDQYELKLQIAGLNEGYDSVVLRGDPDAGRSFACFYFTKGEMIAADCVNRPQEFMFSRRVLGDRIPVAPSQLADPESSLSELLKAAVASKL
ncbi:NAD(P)/FAD-dependent oxidoreductase [Hoyosella altamirensis]|uniref:3-phenylpropionate/trans-cinnamate dioxygenase ferredoxin reductase subunit n=1 Tax=Hoyosella altamirensis TaxID=616997 RepID=A0A839RPH1_9ACTN|nr:FAD-dependent oxidoreductase [Hoyosella altamirensis]MBB3038014.1 3-phenylpropionate/trans-cinnamate dioxygenase ferredoxin reductase subunit [Hoyosella altamirensis]